MTQEQLSADLFLGGKLRILQPKVGYRAATDPVLLAASMELAAGDTVLDVGCGVGVAALCLGTRFPNADFHGLEIQSDYAELAVRNAAENNQTLKVHLGDLLKMPSDIREVGFDHVMTNPPYFDVKAHRAPQSPGKSKAHIADISLTDWIASSLRRVRPLGYFTIIHLVEQLPETISAVSKKCGGITILPIASRSEGNAKRFILRAKKGARGAARLLAPLVMHSGVKHDSDEDDFAPEAVEILRNGGPITRF